MLSGTYGCLSDEERAVDVLEAGPAIVFEAVQDDALAALDDDEVAGGIEFETPGFGQAAGDKLGLPFGMD